MSRTNLYPAIIQEYQTSEILMLGFMNEDALTKTIQTGWVYFWSRRRNKLWLKGETSGNKLKLKEIFTDCDEDTILIKVKLMGKNTCHNGFKTCFYQKYESK